MKTQQELEQIMEEAWEDYHAEALRSYGDWRLGGLYEVYYGAWWDWARLIYPVMPAPRSPLEPASIEDEEAAQAIAEIGAKMTEVVEILTGKRRK